MTCERPADLRRKSVNQSELTATERQLLDSFKDTPKPHMAEIAAKLEGIYLEVLRRRHEQRWGRFKRFDPDAIGSPRQGWNHSVPVDSPQAVWVVLRQLLIYLAFMLPLIGAAWFLWLGSDVLSFAITVLAISYMLIAGEISDLKQLRAEKLLSSELPKTDILVRLVGGDGSIRDIIRHTPWPWSFTHLGYLPNDFKGNALLVAYNIDWYLQPPGRHFRMLWIAQILVALFVVSYLVTNLHGPGTGLSGLLMLGALAFSTQADMYRSEKHLAAMVRLIRRGFRESSRAKPDKDKTSAK